MPGVFTAHQSPGAGQACGSRQSSRTEEGLGVASFPRTEEHPPLPPLSQPCALRTPSGQHGSVRTWAPPRVFAENLFFKPSLPTGFTMQLPRAFELG